jgi:hypothetical protein
VQRAYIIIDPQHEYARELIRIAKERHGLRPICVYIDSRAELYKREHFPELRGPDTLAHYYLDQMSPQVMAEAIKSKFDVVGMMPYFEQSLTPARELMEALSLTWNSADVIRRFRDKSGLKDYLRKHHPEIALGASRRVHNPEEVFSQPLPQAFVIKPNDGFANRDVGFFKQSDSRQSIADYFGNHTGEPFILEELLIGTEFAVNGQMDAAGNATVVSVLEYDRVPANGKPNVYHRTIHVPRTDPHYTAIAEYAKAVMDASGLKRAPFHLELMHTPDGPRLIEVGARFGGTRYVFATNAVHDNVFNHFDVAVHHYLFTTPYEGAGPNWAFYDKISYVHLDGIAERSERIYTLEGISAIEAMPEFDGWVVKPEIGGFIRRTIDLYTVPYSVHLKSFKGRADVVAATERVKQTLKINARVSRPRRLMVDLQAALHRLQMRGRWLARRLGASKAAA